MKKNKNSKKLI